MFRNFVQRNCVCIHNAHLCTDSEIRSPLHKEREEERERKRERAAEGACRVENRFPRENTFVQRHCSTTEEARTSPARRGRLEPRGAAVVKHTQTPRNPGHGAGRAGRGAGSRALRLSRGNSEQIGAAAVPAPGNLESPRDTAVPLRGVRPGDARARTGVEPRPPASSHIRSGAVRSGQTSETAQRPRGPG